MSAAKQMSSQRSSAHSAHFYIHMQLVIQAQISTHHLVLVVTNRQLVVGSFQDFPYKVLRVMIHPLEFLWIYIHEETRRPPRGLLAV